MSSQHAQEVGAGGRFGFGDNWWRFLASLDDTRIMKPKESLRVMLSVEHLRGRRSLNVGSGSGLFSLAARRLGATVDAIDYDPWAVGCTRELKRRDFGDGPQWHIEQGSAPDPEFIARLGHFDVVSSWGILHHTGAMVPFSCARTDAFARWRRPDPGRVGAVGSCGTIHAGPMVHQVGAGRAT